MTKLWLKKKLDTTKNWKNVSMTRNSISIPPRKESFSHFIIFSRNEKSKREKERDGQIRFLRYRYGACDYRTTCSCIPSVHYVLCNWEPDRRMSHSCDLMGDVGSLFIAIARKGRGNRLAETDISSGSRVDVDFRARISEKFLTIYQNF